MKKWLIVPAVLLLIVLCMAVSTTTRVSSYMTFYSCADVNNAPDTTYIDDVNAFAKGVRSSGAIDLLGIPGAGRDTYASKVQLIFSHSSPTDANDKTSTFELYGSVEQGPRQIICTADLTAGISNVTAGDTTVRWVEDANVTDYRTTGVVVDDNTNNRIARITVDCQGLRFLEGLFTGAAKDANTATAYYRFYSEE